MKAAVVHDFKQSLRVEDIAVPEPGHGQAPVRLETSGSCHTDIHAAWRGLASSPHLRSFPVMRVWVRRHDSERDQAARAGEGGHSRGPEPIGGSTTRVQLRR
jgi:threonine dehydrogenase-like Zn-dependent dehydrogenase